MILNNYWNLKAYVQSHAVGSTSTTASPGIKNLSGTITTIAIGYPNANIGYFMMRNYAIHTEMSALFGSGTTAPTSADYCLESDITSSISNRSATFNVSAEDGKIKIVGTLSGTNNNNSAITISEIGITKTIVVSQTSGTATTGTILYIREVLANPITVPAGNSFSFTFTWEENNSESTATVSATRSTPSETRGETKSDSQEETKEEKLSEPISEPLEKKVDESPKEEENPEIEDEKEPKKETKTEEPIEDEPEEEESDER